MKILIISNLYPPQYVGGYELICQIVVEALRARGHCVHVLTSDHEINSAQPRIESGIERALKIHGMFGHTWLPIQKLQNLERHNNRILRTALRYLQPDLVYCWNFS